MLLGLGDHACEIICNDFSAGRIYSQIEELGLREGEGSTKRSRMYSHC